MSLSFSEDDRGGAPLNNEKSFNVAKEATQRTDKQDTLFSLLLGNFNANQSSS